MQNILDFILKNNSLTKEQKSALIQNYYTTINNELDTHLQKELLKKYLGASLEIGSAAIPIGGVGKIGASLSKKLLQKNLGRRLSEQLGANVANGMTTGAVFGAGRGLLEDENLYKTMFQDAAIGGLLGGGAGTTIGKIKQDRKFSELETLNKKRNEWGIAYRKASGNPQKAIDTLLEKQQGFVPNAFSKEGIGNVDIVYGKNGENGYGLAHQIERRNQQGLDGMAFARNLFKTILEGQSGTKANHFDRKYINDKINEIAIRNTYENKSNVENWNWLVSAYPILNNENTFQAIPGRLASGNSFPDMKTPLPDLKSINPIISDFVDKINPTQMITPTFVTNQNAKYNFTSYTNPETGSDMVFSRENISDMNADEFLRYEKDIMNQLKTIGIPFDRDLQNPNSGTVFVKSYVRSDGTKVKSHYRSIR